VRAVRAARAVREAPAARPVVRAAVEPEVRAHAAARAERAAPARMQATMVLLAVPAAAVEQTRRQAKVAPVVPAAMVARVESVEPVEPAESAACLERQRPLSAVSEVSAAFAVCQGSAAPEALTASRKTIPRPRAL